MGRWLALGSEAEASRAVVVVCWCLCVLLAQGQGWPFGSMLGLAELLGLGLDSA